MSAEIAGKTDEAIKLENIEKGQWKLSVQNTPGTTLPATGGPGTMLMFGIGAVVAEITGYGMLRKRRKVAPYSRKAKFLRRH